MIRCLLLLLCLSVLPAAAREPAWVFSDDGTLAQAIVIVPPGYGYPRGSQLALSFAGGQIVGTLTTRSGRTLCTLSGVYEGCSIIDGCGRIGPALDTCGEDWTYTTAWLPATDTPPPPPGQELLHGLLP